MSMKKNGLQILNFVLLVCLGLGTLVCVYKLNQKINQLHATVAELKEEQLQREAAEKTEENDFRNTIIPNLNPEKDDAWKVTQYGNPLGEQEICYTITTASGLVIIDGGYDYEEARLRKIIEQYGNSVEAWILTHPHRDHITAFMDLYEAMPEMVIHHIYLPEHPDVDTMYEKAKWDEYGSVERLREMDIQGLEYLHTGDEIDLMGLKMEILSAFDEDVARLSKDYMNDGSLLFRISGKKNSMLFCSDVGTSMSDFLLKKYGEELESDYVQMGHHGFGGLDAPFYEAVHAKGAFFDAQHYLMVHEERPSSKEKVELMEGLGCVLYTYYTAPNQILIE